MLYSVKVDLKSGSRSPVGSKKTMTLIIAERWSRGRLSEIEKGQQSLRVSLRTFLTTKVIMLEHGSSPVVTHRGKSRGCASRTTSGWVSPEGAGLITLTALDVKRPWEVAAFCRCCPP